MSRQILCFAFLEVFPLSLPLFLIVSEGKNEGNVKKGEKVEKCEKEEEELQDKYYIIPMHLYRFEEKKHKLNRYTQVTGFSPFFQFQCQVFSSKRL